MPTVLQIEQLRREVESLKEKLAQVRGKIAQIRSGEQGGDLDSLKQKVNRLEARRSKLRAECRKKLDAYLEKYTRHATD